jgi:AcrR family transcriptional regulator
METRQRLLAAAAEVFAAKGFWEATHAEICRKAGANTAAINYHFGSKEDLYVAAWKHAFEESLKAHPPDGGVRATAPASERLRGRILSFMHRIADPKNHEVEIMHREMANPTGLLAKVLPRVLEPMQQDARAIIQELLGTGASEQEVSFCEMSLMGQCFAPMLRLRHARRNPDAPRPPGPPLEFRVEDLADHVTRFSLAGIRGMRAEAGKGRRVVRKPRRNKSNSKQE